MHLQSRRTSMHLVGVLTLLLSVAFQAVPHALAAGPTITIQPATADGNCTTGTTNATFTVYLSATSTSPVTVDYATSDGSASSLPAATPQQDYIPTAGTLTFAPGDTVQTFNTTVYCNLAGSPEFDETFSATLSNPTGGATLGAPSTNKATILGVPTITISDYTALEGTPPLSGTTPFTFTIKLARVTTQAVAVTVDTADGTALVADNDYVPIVATPYTIPAGQLSIDVIVNVTKDATNEADENFLVNLSAPTFGGTGVTGVITDPQAIGTIINDDGAPTPSITCLSPVPENIGSVSCTVSLTAASGLPITVNYTTGNNAPGAGVATAPADYTTTSGSLTFAPGTTSLATLPIPIFDDTLNEDPETFFVQLSSSGGTLIGTSNVIINDNDTTLPTVSIGNATVTEGNTPTTVNAVFTVSLSAPSGRTVTVNYATSDVNAVAPGDYLSNANIVTFAPGVTAQNVTIVVNGDNLDEFDETFNVTLSTPVNTNIAPGLGVGIGTILDDDLPPTATITNPNVVEGNTGTTPGVFTVSLSAPSGKPISIDFATADGSATNPADYIATIGTINFAAGETSKTITVPVVGDTLSEDNQTFFVNLSVSASTPGSVTLPTPAQGIGTIIDDDSGPVLTIDDVSVVEGNSGSTNAVFTVSLSASSGKTVTVQYSTANGTATAGSDYTAVGPLTLSFAPGVTSQQIVVPVLGDTLDEDDETFTVNLSSPVNATVGKASGIGTIQDDDAAPVITIGDASVLEGNSGSSVSAAFTISLSQPSGRPVTVLAQTAPGTATEGSDYRADSRTVTFPPGATQQNISIVVVGDDAIEPNENFFVKLSNPVNATIGRDTGEGTIANDDGPTVSISDVTVDEGNSGTTGMSFQVAVKSATAFPVTVQYATSDGTATAGSDYTATSGTLTFTSNQTQTVTVQVTGDQTVEPDETLLVTLSNATGGATIGRAKATGTIKNDDVPVTISMNCPRVVEGNSSFKTVVCNVVLSAASASVITVGYAATNGTALNGLDYIVTPGTLAFTPGITSQTIPMQIIGDTEVESDETFFMSLNTPTGATITVGQSTVTIINDDTTNKQLFLPMTMR